MTLSTHCQNKIGVSYGTPVSYTVQCDHKTFAITYLALSKSEKLENNIPSKQNIIILLNTTVEFLFYSKNITKNTHDQYSKWQVINDIMVTDFEIKLPVYQLCLPSHKNDLE